jgi:hypothetical protein
MLSQLVGIGICFFYAPGSRRHFACVLHLLFMKRLAFHSLPISSRLSLLLLDPSIKIGGQAKEGTKKSQDYKTAH